MRQVVTLWTAAVLYTLAGLIIPSPAEAQTAGIGQEAYAWEEGDLSFALAAGWVATPVAAVEGSAVLDLASADETALIRLIALPAATEDARLRPALEEALIALGIVPVRYADVPLFGLYGQRIEAQSRDGLLAGMGRYGRLPDGRPLILAARAPSADLPALVQTTDDLIASVAFSAESPPSPPSYALSWLWPPAAEEAASDSEVIPTDVKPTPDPALAGLDIIDLAWGEDGLYALERTQGVVRFDPAAGEQSAAFPFANPTNPTALAFNGQLLVGDTVCRCILALNADGTWSSFGAFGAHAPIRLAVGANGAIYAVDRTTDGLYELVTLLDEREISRAPLHFNATDAPLIAALPTGDVIALEWLTSLVDGSTAGALSLVEETGAALETWLPLAPGDALAMLPTRSGGLLLALADSRLALIEGDALVTLLDLPLLARAAAIRADGALAVTDGGSVAVYGVQASMRQGAPELIHDVPVQGTLSETAPAQTWVYTGRAGDEISLSAIDPTRTDMLDVAIRLFAPDGREIAYNDDHLGLDLYGLYDAQIADFTLPVDGIYTVQAEWVRGAGTYTLAVHRTERFTLDGSGVVEITGALQDVLPVQRWAFEARRGQVLTLTMFGEDSLDPALEIIRPDGRTLAYNDDARDPELGINAQLFRLTIPEDGEYVLEASRFEGSGAYRIIVLLNS